MSPITEEMLESLNTDISSNTSVPERNYVKPVIYDSRTVKFNKAN